MKNFKILILLAAVLLFNKLFLINANAANGNVQTLNKVVYQDRDNLGYRHLDRIEESYLSSCMTLSQESEIFYSYDIQSNCNILNLSGNYEIKYSGKFINSLFCGLSKDTWGLVSDEKIEGHQMGAVGYGKIYVLKSNDNVNWEYVACKEIDLNKEVNASVYTNSTDSFSGSIYLKVGVVYEIKNDNSDEVKNISEEYYMILRNSEFNNIYIPGMKDIYLMPQGYSSLKIEDYNDSKTNINVNAYINLKGNNYIKYKIDPSYLNYIEDHYFYHYDEYEAYEINITDSYNNKIQRKVYMNNYTDEELYEEYFGDGFIRDYVRIYDENSEIQVYEQGLKCCLESFKYRELSLIGKIKNLTSKEEIIFNGEDEHQEIVLDNIGEYEAEFYTNPEYGNVRYFYFHFNVVEKGSNKGPSINKRNLEEYSDNNISDYKMSYYGAQLDSYGEGDIIVAFDDEERAKEFIRNNELNKIIEQDEKYIYNEKIYLSYFELSSVINEYADNRVKKYYFDLTNEETYLTAKDLTIDQLKVMELDKNVIVFANEYEKQCLLASTENIIIANKKYNFLDTKEKGINDFHFIKDENGYESNRIIAIDSSDNIFNIDYEKGLFEQLCEYGCSNGLVKIIESNLYEMNTSYYIVFINDNNATISLDYTIKGEKKTIDIESFNQSEYVELKANKFTIKDIADELDQNKIIKLNELYYSKDELINKEFTEEGEYKFEVIDRYGNAIKFNVIIEDTYIFNVEVDGKIYETHYGDSLSINNSRDGYDFLYFQDEDMNKLNNLNDITYERFAKLISIYQPKEYNLVLKNNNELSKEVVKYDSKYILPVLNSNKDYEFVGWNYNGEIIKELTIQETNDVNIEAVYNKKYSDVTFNNEIKRYYVGEEIELKKHENLILKVKGFKINGEFYDDDKYLISEANDLQIEQVYYPNPILLIIPSLVLIGIVSFKIWRKKHEK